MATSVTLSARDLSLLRLLSWTPATTALLLRASISFDGGSFGDERRLRERVQTLRHAGFIRAWPVGHSGGGVQNIYKMTASGFERLYGPDTPLPPRTFFTEISPSLFAHTMQLAEVVVAIVRACHQGRITIVRFFRENELTFAVGESQVQPDCFVRFRFGGKPFNVAFEVDQSQESVDSFATNSIRQKIEIYDAYQAAVLSQWMASGKSWECPRFRVAFLPRSMERGYNILGLAARLITSPKRHLIYAATQDSFLGDAQPLRSPIFLDHCGEWQSLIDLHPTASYRKAPVRLGRPFDPSRSLW